MKVVDNINLLGVKLARTTSRTRELTGPTWWQVCKRNSIISRQGAILHSS